MESDEQEAPTWYRQVIFPPLVAACIVSLIAFVYETTLSSVLLFASVGASALILARRTEHDLSKLRAVVISYVLATAVSLAVYWLHVFVPLDTALGLGVIVFAVGALMLALDVFHPPAVTAALSFFILDRPLIDLLVLFSAIIALLVVLRLTTYALSFRS